MQAAVPDPVRVAVHCTRPNHTPWPDRAAQDVLDAETRPDVIMPATGRKGRARRRNGSSHPPHAEEDRRLNPRTSRWRSRIPTPCIPQPGRPWGGALGLRRHGAHPAHRRVRRPTPVLHRLRGQRARRQIQRELIAQHAPNARLHGTLKSHPAQRNDQLCLIPLTGPPRHVA